ncbi:MAG: tRNA (adenosine(37)-N6)-dimethylallyltransferase MiaA [Oscillospiraceae bacterium]
MAAGIPLLIICGPTASGKTGLAVELAKRYNGEVVGADSMQLYKSMNIGTAKPNSAECQGVPYHLIDFLNPTDTFSVAQFAELCRLTIREIDKRGKLPILCGGTGLYIQAIVDNIQYAEIAEDAELRAQLRAEALQQGNESLWQRLNDCDPALAAGLHPNNLGRVIRGIEVFTLTGKPLSLWQKESVLVPSPYNTLQLGITAHDRQILYDRIDHRVGDMMSAGLMDEAKALLEGGFSKTAGQAIGYKELFGYLEGRQSLDESVEMLKMETRRYAKRQITWFRRDSRIRWLYIDDYTSGQIIEQAEQGINNWATGFER